MYYKSCHWQGREAFKTKEGYKIYDIILARMRMAPFSHAGATLHIYIYIYIYILLDFYFRLCSPLEI